jgi:hypothetical protein
VHDNLSKVPLALECTREYMCQVQCDAIIGKRRRTAGPGGGSLAHRSCVQQREHQVESEVVPMPVPARKCLRPNEKSRRVSDESEAESHESKIPLESFVLAVALRHSASGRFERGSASHMLIAIVLQPITSMKTANCPEERFGLRATSAVGNG